MKTVALVGRGKHRDFAPYDDPRVDIWGMNDYPSYGMKRVTAAFDLHADCMESDRYDEAFREWMRAPHPFPIYMSQYDARVPACRMFPFERLRLFFRGMLFKGDTEVDAFETSTTPHMIRYALYNGYQRIELYGIELTGPIEYEKHRDSVFYWLGVARGMGVQVAIHERSELYKRCAYP